ncbi:hypothetical protein [Microvirga sp. TS319]|uniref:hypothetical protein n=1 Tax=Microvirga sp. TS319 TaxID=3241165 RepID=UPI00351A8B8A
MAQLPQTAPWDDATPVGTRLKAATGTCHPGLQEALVRQVQETMPASSRMIPAHSPDLEEAAVAALTEMQPQNTVQGMLAGQFVALHFASMDCLQRAAEKGTLPAVRDMNLRHTTKLLAAELRVLEVLERLQGRGPVPQPHGPFVNVEPGGQAVVGVQVGMAAAEGSDGRPGADCAQDDERVKRSPGERDPRGIRLG